MIRSLVPAALAVAGLCATVSSAAAHTTGVPHVHVDGVATLGTTTVLVAAGSIFVAAAAFAMVASRKLQARRATRTKSER